MTEFILMLTRDDVTLTNALELLDAVLTTEVIHVGFKDVGLEAAGMRELVARLHAAGRLVHLEIVSLTEEDELRSVEVGLELGVDYLIGGTRWERVAERMRGTDVKYFPYAGRVAGHPAELLGSVDDIVGDAAQMTSEICGVNLLAYRHRELDGATLVRAVNEKVSRPIIVAGSIWSLERVRDVQAAGAWALTIGGAVWDRQLVRGGSTTDQIRAAISAAREGE